VQKLPFKSILRTFLSSEFQENCLASGELRAPQVSSLEAHIFFN